jgi:hypothetical protein
MLVTQVELAGLAFDVVLKMATGVQPHSKGIIVSLVHTSLRGAAQGKRGRRLSVLLSPGQAQALSEDLARKLWRVGRPERLDA